MVSVKLTLNLDDKARSESMFVTLNIIPLTIHAVFHQNPLLILSHGMVGLQAQSLLC